MKKTLAFLLVLVMALSCVTSFAAMDDLTNEQYYSLVQATVTNDDCGNDNLVSAWNDDNLTIQKFFEKDSTTGNIFFRVFTVNGKGVSTQYRGTSTTALYNTPLSSDGTGKYVVEHKIYYKRDSAYADYSLLFQTENNTKTLLGFSIDTSADCAATVKFFYRNERQNIAEHLVDLEGNSSWSFSHETWYTLRHVYDMNSRVAELYIFDASGNQLGHYTHNLLREYKGTNVEIPYGRLYFDGVHVKSASKAYIGLDDLAMYSVKAVPVTANFDSDMVSVTYGDKEVTSGVAAPVNYNGDAVFTVAAKEGHEITGITVDGEEYNSLTEVSFTAIKEAHEFAVTAKELPNEINTYYDRLLKINNENQTPATEALFVASGYSAEENGNVYWYSWPSGSTTHMSASYDATAGTTLSNDFSGEYLISNRIRFTKRGAAYPTSGNVVTVPFSYNSDNTDECYFGFELTWADTDVAAVSFKYNYLDEISTSIPIDSFSYTNDAWYTYEHVYNLDNRTADLYVYDGTGSAVAHFKHELHKIIDGTEIPYSQLITKGITSKVNNRAKVAIDDYIAYKTKAKPVVVNYDSAMGTVTYNGNPVVSGEKIPVAYNSATPAVFAISANEGYEIADVKVNDVSNSIIDSYSFTNIKEDQTMTVEFAAEAPAQPEVTFGSYTPATNYAYTKDGVQKVAPYTVVIYGAVSGSPFEYGFKLGGGNLPETYKMPYVGTPTEDGMFAIRVVGDVLEADTYTATPYLVANNGDADADGTVTDITIE